MTRGFIPPYTFMHILSGLTGSPWAPSIHIDFGDDIAAEA